MTGDEVVRVARAFLSHEFPNRAAEVGELHVGAPLFDLGLVDSLSFLGLVGELEARFGVAVPPEDFTPARFRSLEAIASYVLHAKGAR